MAKIRVRGGRLVDPFNLTDDDIRAIDFPHALAQLNRFCGQCDYPYSVAQHTTILYRHAPAHLRRAALIHDYAEAVFNDVPSPVKAEIPAYKVAEKHALRRIATVYKVPAAELAEFDPYDKSIYVNERNALHGEITERGMGDDREALPGIDPLEFCERPWRWCRNSLQDLIDKEFPDVQRNY